MTVLTSENVLYYLRKRNLLNEAEVVKGNYVVIPVKTRNNIMKVQIAPGSSLFVKQLADEPTAAALFKRETAAYRLFSRYPQTFPASSSVPALLDEQEEDRILVTELLDDAANLHDHYMVSRNFNPELAREQALLLAAYHGVPFREADTRAFPKLLPWVLQLDRYEANQFFVNNEASARVIGLIKENALLQTNLIQLARAWKPTHLIHGDVKWINFLVKKQADGTLIQKLIDWELADLGDPLWDVAGLVQSYIVTWLFGFDNNNPHLYTPPQQMEPYQLRHMQPSAQAFLEQYLQALSYAETERTALLTKVMQYTAARILQTCMEGVTFHSRIEANNMRGVQLAYNIFNDPAYALRELLHINA